MIQRSIALLLFTLLTACSSMGSKNEAADPAVTARDILMQLVWEAKLEEVYANATEEFRESVHLSFMAQRLRHTFESAPQDRIIVEGQAPIGNDTKVFASSISSADNIYYMLTLREVEGEYRLQNLYLQKRNELKKPENYEPREKPLIVDHNIGSILR